MGIGRSQDLDWRSTSSWHSTNGNSPSGCAPSPQFTVDLCLVCQGRNGPSGRHGQSGETRKHYNRVCLSDYQAGLSLVVQVYFRQFPGGASPVRSPHPGRKLLTPRPAHLHRDPRAQSLRLLRSATSQEAAIWNLGTHEFRYDFKIFFIYMNSYMNS